MSPLIAELARRHHRACLVAYGDPGASPYEIRTYLFELASRGWVVVSKYKSGRRYVRFGKDARRARAYLALWKPPVPRLSNHQITEIMRAGQDHEREREARMASRSRRAAAAR